MRIFLIIFLIALIGCPGNSSKMSRHVQFVPNSTHISVENERRVILHSEEAVDHPITIASFQLVGQKMYILDMYGLKQAFIYHLDGSLDQLLSRPGPGPGEYRHPGGFCLSGDRLHLISAGRKYIIYNPDGSLIKENLEIHPGGIGNKIHPGRDGSAYFTCYTRYYPEATIFHVNRDGELLSQFSPPDEDFVKLWDKVDPMGNIIVEDDHIAQVFIHKYDVHFFGLDGEKIKKVHLVSGIYDPPDYAKATSLPNKSGKIQKAFYQKYSLINSFFKMGSYYVTGLANTKLKKDRDYLEFWSDEFYGLGRYLVPEGEKLVGSHGNELVFYDVESTTLIFRTFSTQNIGPQQAAP